MIKLICMDLGGVLVDNHAFWMELHKKYGTLEEGAALTKAHLGTSYAKLVEEVTGKLWRGKSQGPYFELVNEIRFIPGIEEFFIELNKFTTNGEPVPRAIISSSSYDLAMRVSNEFGITFVFANQLLFENGVATGEFKWPVGAGGYTKAQIIEQLCDDLEILPQNVLMIGDSDSDYEAFRICGASIAFNCATEKLKSVATYVVNSSDLRDMVPVLQRIRHEAGVGTPTEGPGHGP